MSRLEPSVGQASLRSRNKSKRRNAVLDAALDLLDGPDAQSVTAEHVAERAEVSVATVYNLVGTREQLLMALVDRLIDDLITSLGGATPADDPIEDLRQLIRASVEVLTRRPNAFREIVLQLTATSNGHLHTTLNPSTAATEAFERAQQLDILRDDLDPAMLGLQLYLSYNGALFRWAAGGLTDAGFLAATLHALSTIAAAGASTRSRRATLADLRACETDLRDAIDLNGPKRKA